jgi:hypothetical protein
VGVFFLENLGFSHHWIELAKLLPEMLFKRFNSAYVKETYRRDVYALTGQDAFDILVKTLKYCLYELEQAEEVLHRSDDEVTVVDMSTKSGEMNEDVFSDDSYEMESRKPSVNLVLPSFYYDCQQRSANLFRDDNGENPIQGAVIRCENNDTLETVDDDVLTDRSYHVYVEYDDHEEQEECSSVEVNTYILEKDPTTGELGQSNRDFVAEPASVNLIEKDVKSYSVGKDFPDLGTVCNLPEVVYVDRVYAADSENSSSETVTADVNANDTSGAIVMNADDAADEHIDVTSDVKAVYEKEFDIANSSMEFLALDVLEEEQDFDNFIDMIDVAAAKCSKVANLKGIAGQFWKKKRILLDFTTVIGRVGIKNCSCFFLLVGISNLLTILVGLMLSCKHMHDQAESDQVRKKSCEYSKFEVNELVVYLNQDDAYPRKRKQKRV